MSASEYRNQIDTSAYYGAEVLNRVLFLREDVEFISKLIVHSSTRFIFYNQGHPLFNKGAIKGLKLVVLTNGDSQQQQHKGLWSSQIWRSTLDTWISDNRTKDPGLRDNNKPVFLFLGLKDESVGLDLNKVKISEDEERYFDHQGRYQGIPYYGVDVSKLEQLRQLIVNHILESDKQVNEKSLFFTTSRKHVLGMLTPEEAALFSHGKMFIDWLDRNRFCPGCGSKTIPIHGGGKIYCTNEETKQVEDDKGETIDKFVCPVKSVSVSNVSFPRTDAVVIIAIVNKERTKMLLLLHKRYNFAKMYTCTAGFMEPSETVETAAKREIWEETGVVCSEIQMVKTQPWPFPANLMIGCVATVEFNGINEQIHLGHDNELDDARWFDIDYVKKLLEVAGSRDDEELDMLFNPEGLALPAPESLAYQIIKIAVNESKDSKL
ncbi:NADH pyrophosphatase [Scheffersomyces spartinae]|uniref:NAD(+) diphosphatase n=1 Tax=Scheffersomyces spartinae TaxID=45513 RepID=A0A9P7V9Z7_9ASCO|nr:NADH pyrophosphatase [Scheffersomyces spartinae]KAG7194093.1 NADH pyrophosphatase [Scheffersomyces spartinae]